MRGFDKAVKERSPREIEAQLEGKGDYVKINYLERALRSGLDFETKKFVLLRLAKIYESKGMFSDAARTIKIAADINTTYRGQMLDYMKSVELYIKSGNYIEADGVFTQAIVLGNEKEKSVMKTNFKNYYMNQAKVLLNENKRNHAKKIFERLLKFKLEPGERIEVQKTLLDLYQKLGNFRDYYKLKDSM